MDVKTLEHLEEELRNIRSALRKQRQDLQAQDAIDEFNLEKMPSNFHWEWRGICDLDLFSEVDLYGYPQNAEALALIEAYGEPYTRKGPLNRGMRKLYDAYCEAFANEEDCVVLRLALTVEQLEKFLERSDVVFKSSSTAVIERLEELKSEANMRMQRSDILKDKLKAKIV